MSTGEISNDHESSSENNEMCQSDVEYSFFGSMNGADDLLEESQLCNNSGSEQVIENRSTIINDDYIVDGHDDEHRTKDKNSRVDCEIPAFLAPCSYFGTTVDSKKPSPLLNDNSFKLTDISFGLNSRPCLTDDAALTWNNLPDLSKCWRVNEKPQRNPELMNAILTPHLDSNLVTVTEAECHLYNQTYYVETSRCSPCEFLGKYCTFDHGICHCLGKSHMVFVQNPIDIKRLRRVRKLLAYKSIPNHIMKMESAAKVFVRRANAAFSPITGNCEGIQFSANSGKKNEQSFKSYSKWQPMDNLVNGNLHYAKNNSLASIQSIKTSFESNIGLKNVKTPEANGIKEPKKMDLPASATLSKGATDQTKPSNVPTKILKNPNKERSTLSQILLNKPPCGNISEIQKTKLIDGNNSSGTPDRLEETKRLRAQIREQQLLRQKQREGAKHQSIKQKTRPTQDPNRKNVEASNANMEAGQKIKQKANVPKLSMFPSWKQTSSNNGSNNGNIYAGTSNGAGIVNKVYSKTVLQRNSCPLPLSSKMSNLGIQESVFKEKSDLSERILSSPRLRSRHSSLLSTNGIRNNHCTHPDTLEIQPKSMFKDFEPVKMQSLVL